MEISDFKCHSSIKSDREKHQGQLVSWCFLSSAKSLLPGVKVGCTASLVFLYLCALFIK